MRRAPASPLRRVADMGGDPHGTRPDTPRVARHAPGKADGMRLLLILIALVIAVVVADVLIGREAEDRATQTLREELAARTGAEPDRVAVELEGWLAALRLLTGPAPDATATVRGLKLPDTAGPLTRLQVDFDGVRADASEVLNGAPEGQLPFSAQSGAFRAVLGEDDLNRVLGASQLFERLKVEKSGIKAIPAAAGNREPVPLTTELSSGAGGGDVLVLRPEQTEATRQALGPPLAGSTLTIPFVLPDAMDLQKIQTRSDRLIGTGTVDVEALVAGSGSS